MTGFTSVDFPTKKYIAAYVKAQFGGGKPLMTRDNPIGSKLYDLLQHKTNERKAEFSLLRYNTILRIYIPKSTFRIRGAFLNETNVRQLNRYIEFKVKHEFYYKMDFLMKNYASIEAHMPTIRQELGIDIEEWSDDSMKKDYYRYRKAKGKPPLYKHVARGNTSRFESAEHAMF